MKHITAAQRFYKAPTAGRYLLAAAQAFPNAHVTVQHAYAMHMYARCSNAAQQEYLHSNGAANLHRIATIKLSTLQQYMPFVKPAMAQRCMARWHAYNTRMQEIRAANLAKWHQQAANHMLLRNAPTDNMH